MKIEFNSKNLEKNYDKIVVRKFLDIKDSFKNPNIKGNPILYKVFIKDYGNFEHGLTIINPGCINKEFFMTKGHKHKNPVEEIYIPLSGKGKLLLQGKPSKVLELKKNKIYIIPKKTAHRLINTGNKKLVVFTIYSKDAGHDYNFKFTKRFLK